MDKRFENVIRHFADSHGLKYEIGEDRVKLNGDIFSPEAALYYMFGFVDGEAFEAKKLFLDFKKMEKEQQNE